jgi:hypothetical protein
MGSWLNRVQAHSDCNTAITTDKKTQKRRLATLQNLRKHFCRFCR